MKANTLVKWKYNYIPNCREIVHVTRLELSKLQVEIAQNVVSETSLEGFFAFLSHRDLTEQLTFAIMALCCLRECNDCTFPEDNNSLPDNLLSLLETS